VDFPIQLGFGLELHFLRLEVVIGRLWLRRIASSTTAGW